MIFIGVKLSYKVKGWARLTLDATRVLDHADVHDAHHIRVTLKRKVTPEGGASGRIASHRDNVLDDSRAELRVVTHQLRDEDRSVLMTVAENVSENVTDEGRKRSEHSFCFHDFIRSKLS
jgi:hypothetical protein